MPKPAEIKLEALGLRAWVGRSRPMAMAHYHHDLELNYILSGSLTYLIAGALVTLPPRRLCALWGAVPHQNMRLDAEPPEAIWVTVPLSQVLTWRLPAPLMKRLLSEGIAVENREQPGDPGLLHQWLDDLRSDGKGKLPHHVTLLEIEARLWRMAARLPRSRRAAGKQGGEAAAEVPVAVERLAGFLARHYREPVTMEAAAHFAHVHPNYATVIFRRHTGLTLHGYLTLQRVAHAQRLLATTAQPILDVAFESGFA